MVGVIFEGEEGGTGGGIPKDYLQDLWEQEEGAQAEGKGKGEHRGSHSFGNECRPLLGVGRHLGVPLF